MSLSYPTIYKRIKAHLANAAGLNPRDIFAPDEIRKPPLGLTEQRVRDLAPKLNTIFSDCGLNVTRAQCAAQKTVKDLADLVRGEIT